MIPESVKKDWAVKEKDEKVRFRTFHVKLGEYGGVMKGSITAVTVPMNKEHTKFTTQFSYLSPKEKRGFCRQTAKDIALARLNNFHTVIDVELEKGEKLKDQLKNAIIAEAVRKDIHWLEGMDTENLV